MRSGLSISLSPSDRDRLDRIIKDRNWRAEIVVLARVSARTRSCSELGLRRSACGDGKAIHVTLVNYAAHKHPKVREWLGRHPRFTFHFTPTSSSWLNAVEGFFSKLTNRRLKRGIFHSLIDLHAAINRFLAEHNESPRPFVWTADPCKIIAAARRGHQVLEPDPKVVEQCQHVMIHAVLREME